MTKFDLIRETDISKAIKYYLETLGIKKSKTAAKFLVLYRQFKARLNSRPAQNTKEGNNTVLSVTQKDKLRSTFLTAIIRYRPTLLSQGLFILHKEKLA